MPLRTVLRPDTNAKLVLCVARLLNHLYNTSTKVLAALGSLGVGHPGVLFLEGLGGRKPLADTEASTVAVLGHSELKHVVD